MVLNTNKQKTTATNPALWQRVKKKARATSEGSEPGRWSAQKAAIAQREYKKAGGGWKKAPAPQAPKKK